MIKNKHAGNTRQLIWQSQSYYAESAKREGVIDDITIGFYAPYGGTSGEFIIEWTMLGGKLIPQLKAYDDSWSTLSLCCDLLAKMAEVDDQYISPADFVKLAESCGIVDVTERVRK
jgi:hypothetical protein